MFSLLKSINSHQWVNNWWALSETPEACVCPCVPLDTRNQHCWLPCGHYLNFWHSIFSLEFELQWQARTPWGFFCLFPKDRDSQLTLPALLRFYMVMQTRSCCLDREPFPHWVTCSDPKPFWCSRQSMVCYLKEIKERVKWDKKQGSVENQFY